MPKQQKRIREWVEEAKRKRRSQSKDREFTIQEQIQAMQKDPKGRQMIEDSPIYEMKDGKERRIKSRTGPRRSVSFSIPKQNWKQKKKE